ncbi:MAG: 50S ribosomal protein L5 [Acidimicrobiia bacterium]|nr:50S ribosomal protein L5 [Acidimicrobiia bacterium]
MAKETKKTGSEQAGSSYESRLRKHYQDEVVPSLQQEFGIENIMAVPRINKIVVNVGLGEATQNVKLLDDAAEELTQLTGQRAVITRARKSIANFKLREGMPIGCRVTLRGRQMWDFLDRLISTALPRVRDFRGIPTKSFDGRGNFTLGIRDHLIFPDLDYNKIDKPKGLNVTIVTSAERDDQALHLLRGLGMPFRKAS